MRYIYHEGEAKYPAKTEKSREHISFAGVLVLYWCLNFIADIKCHVLKENFPDDFSTFL